MAARPEGTPGAAALFAAFFVIGISAFGGVLPWARRMLVERRAWLDAEGFNDLLSLCQLVPGPNIVNFAVVFGDRCRGPFGSVAAVSGVLVGPMVIVVTLTVLLGELPGQRYVAGAFHGLSAAAAGLVVVAAIKIGQPLLAPKSGRRDRLAMLIALIAFVVIGLFRFALLPSVVTLAPLAVLLQYRRHRA